MKIIEKFIKNIIFKRDLKILKKAFRDNLLSGGQLILKTKEIPIVRLLGVLTAYICTNDDNISLVVPVDNIKQSVLKSFGSEVPCMTTTDFYRNIENYSYVGKTFIFLPVPIIVQSEIYDKAVDREFKILFCE